MKIILTIPGEAVAKQRPRIGRRGRFSHIYTPDKTMNWETFIKHLFTEKYPDFVPIEGPVSLRVAVFRMIPQSTSTKKRMKMFSDEISPTTRPDLDNVVKSVCDALNHVAFHDDSQIVQLSASKFYSNVARTEIFIDKIILGRRV